ncbi:LysR family transcriptional regulator [Proteus mirabilis]|uniref:LysR family transcriptional regulator n=1 Tax=Proteus mirabilis TaxID=584 RepID=A0A379GI23_PROMI|nr:LysR family transcriptional regulator [Proteus mirabilis]
MSNKPLHRIDLNLLVIFQILLQERSVTLAAKWLSISPSAVSKALAKLRIWFDDPLFIRSPQGLIPTPLSLSIEDSLSDFINISHHIANKRNTEVPVGLKFNLVLETPLHQVMLPSLPQQILSHYPKSTLQIKNWEYNSPF